MSTLANHTSDTKIIWISLISPEICQFTDLRPSDNKNNLDLHQIKMTLTFYHFQIVIYGRSTLTNHILDAKIIQIPLICSDICQFRDLGHNDGKNGIDLRQIHMTLTSYHFPNVINGMGIPTNHISDTKIIQISFICQEICPFIDFGSPDGGHFGNMQIKKMPRGPQPHSRQKLWIWAHTNSNQSKNKLLYEFPG